MQSSPMAEDKAVTTSSKTIFIKCLFKLNCFPGHLFIECFSIQSWWCISYSNALYSVCFNFSRFVQMSLWCQHFLKNPAKLKNNVWSLGQSKCVVQLLFCQHCSSVSDGNVRQSNCYFAIGKVGIMRIRLVLWILACN